MSATYERTEDYTLCISDAAMAAYAAEAAAKAQSARRNEIVSGAVAAAATFFAIVELLKQVGGL